MADAAEGSLYDRLGVAADAAVPDIRRAWLQRARENHPDFHSDADAPTRARIEREMQSINEAWGVLGDPERRRRYDEGLRVATSGSGGRQAPGPARYDFVPYDDGDDDIDAARFDDEGVEGTEVSRSIQVAPIVCLLGGLAGVIVGVIIGLGFLIAVGIVGLVLAGVGFLAAPIVAISRSIRAERDR
jgi:curved DNA-binding protein CbpA